MLGVLHRAVTKCCQWLSQALCWDARVLVLLCLPSRQQMSSNKLKHLCSKAVPPPTHKGASAAASSFKQGAVLLPIPALPRWRNRQTRQISALLALVLGL